REMGAYYTKEDITEYISKNTIVPALFAMARNSCRIAFDGDQSIWRPLRTDPDRSIHASMLKGIEEQLPSEVAAGLNVLKNRGAWNKPAEPQYSLPTET